MKMKISKIEDIIKDASQGKVFILIDDENRENEGDLCILGDFVNPKVINFMAKYGRGLICLAITKQQSDKLGLSLMERKNESRYDSPTYRESFDKKYYVVFNKSTGKILKSINYTPACFKVILN